MYRQICGGAESVNDDIAARCKNILPNILKSPNDVIDAHEFGLFFKLMPGKPLVFKHEKLLRWQTMGQVYQF